MPVGGELSSGQPDGRDVPGWLTSGFRGLWTALLYLVVCVASFVAVVVLFSIAESLWLNR